MMLTTEVNTEVTTWHHLAPHGLHTGQQSTLYNAVKEKYLVDEK